jgi:ADP-L-glycero-D-manno-heptose 6-epimerase
MSAANGCRKARGDAPLSLAELREQGLLEYIAFPEALKGKYQAFTQADLGKLRAAGYDAPMATVEEGVAQYIEWLHKHV